MSVLEISSISKSFAMRGGLFNKSLPAKKYEQSLVLDNVSLAVHEGQILGVIGCNGAGKTTLFRILADLLSADTGIVAISGKNRELLGRSYRSLIGYVSSDERSFFWRLTGRENLEFFARLHGMSPGKARATADRQIVKFDFAAKADELFRDYSAGMRKKLTVMRAIMHSPRLLLLDEVTNSLDPESSRMIKKFVTSYVKEKAGIAALWSTHRLEELDQVCDAWVTIENGRLSANAGHFNEK